MQANVRSIEGLDQLRSAVLELAQRLGDLALEAGLQADHAARWVQEEAPAYWRGELDKAERQLREALDYLASLEATVGGRDKPPATECRKRIGRLRQRVRLCQQRLAACKGWAAELDRAAILLRTTTGALGEAAETNLPLAASRLEQWIAALARYAETNPTAPQAAPTTLGDVKAGATTASSAGRSTTDPSSHLPRS